MTVQSSIHDVQESEANGLCVDWILLGDSIDFIRFRNTRIFTVQYIAWNPLGERLSCPIRE